MCEAQVGDGYVCKVPSSAQYGVISNCEALNIHYNRWATEGLYIKLVLGKLRELRELSDLSVFIDANREAFEVVQGAIREINLQLQVDQNATSELLVELDTLKGRQAAIATLQVVQFFLFALRRMPPATGPRCHRDTAAGGWESNQRPSTRGQHPAPSTQPSRPLASRYSPTVHSYCSYCSSINSNNNNSIK